MGTGQNGHIPKRPHRRLALLTETATDVCRNGHTTIVSPAETATDVCRNGHTKSDDTTILLSNV